MNTLKAQIFNKFVDEIKFAEKYKNSIFSSKDSFLENIDIICDALENKTLLTDVYEMQVKRTIFDNAIPSESLKLVWFVSSKEDNLELFQWACDGLGWLKGSEKTIAANCLKDDLKQYQPEKIIKFLLDTQENKDVQFIAHLMSPILLYFVEGKEKKIQHKLVGKSMFISNNIETYEFLKQTQDEQLFNKIMKKHMKNFAFYKGNIILQKSNEDREIKFYSHFFDESNDLDKLEKIKNLKEMNLHNIANYISSYDLNKSLQESLIEKDTPRRKIKI